MSRKVYNVRISCVVLQISFFFFVLINDITHTHTHTHTHTPKQITLDINIILFSFTSFRCLQHWLAALDKIQFCTIFWWFTWLLQLNCVQCQRIKSEFYHSCEIWPSSSKSLTLIEIVHLLQVCMYPLLLGWAATQTDTETLLHSLWVTIAN